MVLFRIGLAIAVLAVAACAAPADPAVGRLGAAAAFQVPTVADEHNSAHALDWAGTYYGVVLPCADCRGVDTTLTLNGNLTYALVQRYQGSELEDKASGTFVWDDAGQQVLLDADGDSRRFFVGEGFVRHNKRAGTQPAGSEASAYVLKKIPALP